LTSDSHINVLRLSREGAAEWVAQGPCAAALNQLLCCCNLSWLEPVTRVEFNGRFNPEFGLALRMLDMHMRPQLFAREKVEAKASTAQNRRLTGTG
jgi:hypothetical protein